MTRSRSINGAARRPFRPAGCSRWGGRPLLLLLLLGLLSGSPAAWAQPPAGAAALGTAADSAAAPVARPASNGTLVWAVLGGVAIGALGVWLWTRRSAGKSGAENVLPEPARPAPAEPVRKKPAAQNVYKSSPDAPAIPAKNPAPPVVPTAPAPAENPGKGVSFQSMREVQGTKPKPANRPAGKDKKSKPNFNSRPPSADKADAWPTIAPRPSAMNPTIPTPPTGPEQPLEPGQTIEWAAPTSTPPAIQELIEASAPEATGVPAETSAAAEAAVAPNNGPLHYYAPAPDVPSIEHRKLSPNPLPQMPLLITLPHSEATTAQFSFSPQADQSRIIGNGVRELKEFFQFELPPTEQFTTIKNLTAGKLERRDDAWHVVQKASIALS
ncbi:hypothetical protein Q5H92_00395 [Hymenobacter sp. M29]|uniref:Uncharacterized protein n=1 Tax=Hymenobacter mellowenesis TaxID=3063995 RepID=A0ABT9A4M6_9BACT|nr:hypothetical protein [Hymenobacter sp. M29]MDO7844798.1 hypothetical protein [Hymenobacter sp. M29]